MINVYGRDDDGVGDDEANIVINLVTRGNPATEEFMAWAETTPMQIHMSHGTLNSLRHLVTTRFMPLYSNIIMLDTNEQLMQFKLRWHGSDGVQIQMISDFTRRP